MEIDINNDHVEPVSTKGQLSTGINTNYDNSQASILIDDDDDVSATDVVIGGRITPMQKQKTIDITSHESKSNRMEHLDLSTPTVSTITTAEYSDNSGIVCPIITSIASGSQVTAKMEFGIESNEIGENENEEILDQEDVADPQKSNELNLSQDIITETNFEDDGIEFADDGIEYFEERNDEIELDNAHEAQDNEDAVLETAGSPKFDLKLLMNPVVYTTKLDVMNVYRGKSVYDTINNKNDIDKIDTESKPVSAQSVNVQTIQTENQNIGKGENAVQVKTEINDHQEFDDDLFQNDSTDDENSVPESKRVKLTSTLLQKPRCRSYNPIQLCKNPDFNTRLKRLNIGFFSYHRNRVFLKACKPMTIDLSKSFESKLVNGTMYLKSSASEIKQEVETVCDDSESAASVVPSAVAVQSLMDTTDVDKILQEELRKRMLERNKPITLPNISLVRQINQHLLMAEVAPIMIQNEKSSSELLETVHDQIESVETAPTETANAAPTNNDKGISPTTEANAEKTEESTHTVVTNISTPLLPMPQNVTKPNDDDDKNKKQKNKKKTTAKPVPTWISKFNTGDFNPFGESLLTIDTLYKILNALDPAVIYKSKPSKNAKLYGHKIGRPPNNKVQKAVDSTPTEKIVTDCTKSDETQPSIDLTESTDKGEEITPLPVPSKTTKKCRSKRNNYCCWSRAKIINFETPTHRCPKHRCRQGQCKCCCKEALRQAEIEEEIKLLERLQNREKYVDTIEEVVQQSRNISTNLNRNASILIPDSKESEINTEIMTPSNVDNEVTIDINEGDKSIETPRPVLRVFAGDSVSNQRKTMEQRQIERPTVNRQQPNDATINTPIGNQPFLVVEPKLTNPESKLPKPKRARHAFGKKTTTVPLKYSLTEADAEELPCTCRPNVLVNGLPDARRMLVVDGSNECKQHSTSRVSKETRIYLNRKHLSGSERPFFVGKNKILLTNIKPLRLQNKEPESQTPVQPPPPVQPLLPVQPLPPVQQLQPVQPTLPQETPTEPGSLELPAGVQIVLLPDGTISYVVDPGVVLTQQQILAMPLILQAVQQQISATGYTLPIHDPPPSEEGKSALENNNEAENNLETISLDDDEESSNKSVQNLENNKETNCVSTEQVQVVNNTTNDSDTQFENRNVFVDDNNKGLTTESPVYNTEPVTVTDNEVNEVTNKTTNCENTTITAEAVTTDNTAASSRNLLSDLMEMSGILEEDVSPIQDIASPPMNAPETTENLEPVEATRPTSPHQTISAQINEKTYNLNAVVSFSELKYACQNNGLFFKLDLVTGLIVPINVCIQKTQEPRKVSNDVIDLTDEPVDQTEAAGEENIISMGNEQMSFQIRPRNLETLIEKPGKSGKMTGSVYIGNSRSIEDKKKALMERLSNNLKPLSLIQHDRLQTINILKKNASRRRRTAEEKLAIVANFKKRIEAKINLEDSDAPMEEEYLEESSDDDEPLAKVAKKMRANEENKINVNNIEESADTAHETIDFEEAIDAVKSPPNSLLRSNTVANEPPVPRQLMLSGVTDNQPIILNKAFLQDESEEDSQDDCILGV